VALGLGESGFEIEMRDRRGRRLKNWPFCMLCEEHFQNGGWLELAALDSSLMLNHSGETADSGGQRLAGGDGVIDAGDLAVECRQRIGVVVRGQELAKECPGQLGGAGSSHGWK
jgi:hypothetical protein